MVAMNVSEQGIALIKSFESCKLTAYKALSTEEYYTIGWGHYGAEVKAGQTISQSEADALFSVDIQRFVRYTNSYTASLGLDQNQFDALVSFCYNCGPGTLKKLVSGRSVEEIAEHMTDYTKSKGKVIKGLVRRREKEKELFCKGSEVKMAIIVGSARIDERGKVSGGVAGDQKQKPFGNDMSGEISMQAMYNHSKGWYIIRPKNVAHAAKMADLMKAACNNANIGYDQDKRLGVIQHGIMTEVKTACDCSSLVREVIREATGKDPGNFTTANEAAMLEATGLFAKRQAYVSQSKTPVYNGDVLVTKVKGHTVIVTSGNPRVSEGFPGNANAGTASAALSTKLQSAKSKDSRLSGIYEITTSLNLRYGPDSGKYAPVVVMPKGTKFQCYGYYTDVSGTKWLYGIAVVNGKQYTGFASMGKNGEYLKK